MPLQDSDVESLLSIDHLQQKINEIERLINQYIGLIAGFKLAKCGLIRHQRKTRSPYPKKNIRKNDVILFHHPLLLYWEAAIKIAEDKINAFKTEKKCLEKQLMDWHHRKNSIKNAKTNEFQITEVDLAHALQNTLNDLSSNNINDSHQHDIMGSPALSGFFSEQVADEEDEEENGYVSESELLSGKAVL